MGHHISAVVLRGPFDADKAAAFDMKPHPLSSDLTLFPLRAVWVDFWAEKLGVSDPVDAAPLLNWGVVHQCINAIVDDPLFALVETDYVGGTGAQSAAVYRGAVVVMPPECTSISRGLNSFGPINRALRLLGVLPVRGSDEFGTVGLERFRDFDGLFETYR